MVKLIGSIQSATDRQKTLNEVEKNHLALLQQIAEYRNSKIDDSVKAKERELAIAKSQNKSLAEQYRIEDELLELKSKRANANLGFYAQEVHDLDENRRKLMEYQKQLSEAQDAKALGNGKVKVDLKLNGEVKKQDVDDAIEALQGIVDNLQKKVEVGVKVKDDAEQAKVDAAKLAEQRRNAALQAASAALQAASVERSAVRETESLRISLMRDYYDKSIAATKAETASKIQDLKVRLAQEKDLTLKARMAINEQIKLLQKKQNEDLEEIEREHQQKLVAIRRQIEDEAVTSAPRTADQQREDLRRQYQRRYEDVMNEITSGQADGTLSSEEIEEKFKLLEAIRKRYQAEVTILDNQLQSRSIDTMQETIALRLAAVREGSAEELKIRIEQIEAERQAELAANRQKAADERQDENLIKKKYDKLYKDLSANLSRALINDTLGDVFVEATYENVKEAFAKVDEMMNMDDFNLGMFIGTFDTDKIAAFRSELEKVERELKQLGKGGYTLKKALDDAFGKGKTAEDREMGINAIIGGLNTAADLTGKMASAMDAFAKASGNIELQKIADTFSFVSDTLATAGGYAAAGAQIGGGLGAAIGAGVGILQSIATSIFNSSAEEAQRAQENEDNAKQYVNNIIDKIGAVIGSIESLQSTVASLNYNQYQKSLLDAINELRMSTYDSRSNWSAIYNAGNSRDILENGLLDDAHIVQLARDLMGEYNESTAGILSNFTGQLTEAEREILMSYLKMVQQGNNMTINRNGESYSVRQWIRSTYASQANHQDYELEQRRLALLQEMTELYKSGTVSAEEYFKVQMKANQYNLDMLNQRLAELRSQDQTEETHAAIIELENQIAELSYNIQNSFKEMFEGLAGVDLQSLANKWLDIFKEFGDDITTVFEKIDESIDDMIRNIIYQTFFIQPLMQELNKVVEAQMKKIAESQHIDTSKEGWQSLINWGDIASDEYEQFMEDTARQLGETGKTLGQTLWEGVMAGMESAGVSMPTTESERTAQAHGIGSFSQESMDEANGRLTSVQGHTFNLSENSNIIRDNIVAINGNVALIRDYTSNLVQMRNDMGAMRNEIQYIRQHGVQIQSA